ncbi:hypothetical protein DH2020_037916 [Rehmannia glutinosa]|uniref:Uncharacterized protein n=1 Tax=Rehmannia glutinosa TaxID=99300 RepID=A0ABR0V091_REHGL
MAIKSALFLLAFILLVTRMGSSVEDVDNIETEHHHHHSHVNAPAKAPVHAPTKAPAYGPKKAPARAPVHAQAKSPVHSEPNAPAYAPVSFPHGCVAKCASYCKPVSPKRPCMKTCTACCAKCKCVPSGIHKCTNWDQVMIRGHMVNCP